MIVDTEELERLFQSFRNIGHKVPPGQGRICGAANAQAACGLMLPWYMYSTKPGGKFGMESRCKPCRCKYSPSSGWSGVIYPKLINMLAETRAWVYIFADKARTTIKVGRTIRDPRDRLADCMTGSAVELEIIAAMPCTTDGRQEEREMHELLRPWQIRTTGRGKEWFTLPQSAIIMLENIPQAKGGLTVSNLVDVLATYIPKLRLALV